jgi:8-oxo-dGTP diphosphatase
MAPVKPSPDAPVILAAGGVLYRHAAEGEEVLVIHRKRYGDWTLPKGKLKDGEQLIAAALREVEEETGCVARIDKYLGAIGYEVNNIPKAVLFWRMSLVKQTQIEDRDEVAEALWMPVTAAVQRLSYADERALVLRATKGVQNYTEPAAMDLPPLRGYQRWLWAKRHDYARLQREYRAFRVDFALLESRNGQSEQPWAAAARSQIDIIQYYLTSENKDVEGGWVCLHAARRYTVNALDLKELTIQASVLRAEATKFTSWRAKEMEKLLSVKEEQVKKENELTEEQRLKKEKREQEELKALVIRAMELRDEYFSNQYHKIWLMGSQLWTLLVSSGIGLVLLIPFLISYTRQPEIPLTPWTYHVVAAALFFGLLGAAISAAGSLMSDRVSGIPERVGNQFVTIARSLFGAGVGLAGYVFYQSKVLDINIGSDRGWAGAFAAALLFGFGGERLIVRVLGSVGADK